MKTFLTFFVALLLATGAFAQDNYKVKSGDTLRIEVLEDPQLNRDVLVLPDGRFSFPFAGSVLAGGQTLGQIQSAIAAGISSNFASAPNVFASIQALRPRIAGGVAGPATIDVYFLGEINNPGLIKMERGTTFLQALAQNGGFAKFAAKKRVQLRRTNPATGAQSLSTINYRNIANGGDLSQNIVLQDGDVILVPERRLFE